MGALSQFLLLLWKNWLIQKRKVVLTLFEVGVPTLFALILVLIRQRVESTNYDSPSSWGDFSVDKFDKDFRPPSSLPPILRNKSWGLAYTPKTAVTKRIVNRVAQDLGMHIKTRFIDLGFETEDEMVKYLTADNATNTGVLGGIVFSGGIADGGNNLTFDIQYKIRLRAGQFANLGKNRINLRITSDWYTELMFPLRTALGPRSNNSRGGRPNYAREGFLQLQHAIDSSIIDEVGGPEAEERIKKVEVRMKRFPYPPFIDDPFILVIQQQFPFIILLSFIITAPNIVKDVVLEKERKLKESMKMMGLSAWLHWLAWFVKYFMFLIIAVIIMTILFCAKLGKGSILMASDGSLIFVFLMLYSMSIISFCFAISTFFSKANSGAAAGGILFLFSYIPYYFLYERYSMISFGTKMATCLFNNVAMSFGCYLISLYEGTGAGMQWSNFYKPVTTDDNFNMALVFVMLIVDTIFYAIITWYFDNVLPGEFGIAKPFYFPFSKKYWCGTSSAKVNSADLEMSYNENPSALFEKTTNMKAGISFHNLRKEFTRGSQKKVAVSDINLEMFEGQITALLGHNGAGKTTTISMLTGFIPATSGTAYVNGYDISVDIGKVRSSLGLCPQHDILFDSLTVKEHLKFFARLKGYPSNQVEEEVVKMIGLLKLESKTDVQAQELSGGMKRKLSVGIALIAGSKVVILDEPTSGMDPEARRQIWDILQSARAGRTMVLTTHYMDEADLLGDRIAIMADGVIKCCGSSLFLKNKYGVGYHMSMVKDPTCNVEFVTDIIKRYVPDAALESNISAELSFVLPHESASRFEELFTFLETQKNEIGILSYGASVTTMEEVFLKVGELQNDTLHDRLQNGIARSEQAAENPDGNSNGTTEATVRAVATGVMSALANESNHLEKVTFVNGGLVTEAGSWHPDDRPRNDCKLRYRRASSIPEGLPPVFGTGYTRNRGPALYIQQFRALFVKRIIHSWRNKIVSLTQLFVPIFFTIIGCVVLKTLPSSTDDPYPLTLNMDAFSDQVALYHTNDTLDPSGLTEQLTNSYREYMGSVQKGIGQIKETSDLERIILGLDMDAYNRDYMVAAAFEGQEGENNQTKVTAYFNNQAYHTIAISLSMVGNTMLRSLTGNSDYTIETINHPLPRTTAAMLQQDMATQLTVAFAVSYNVMFGMAFLVGTFAVFLIKERAVKSKHIQYVSGVHTVTYWFSTFAWDLINYLIPATLLLAVFAAFQVDAYIADNNLGYVFLLLVLYGWAVLPFIYLLSHLFSVPATGYVWITVLNIFTGTAAVLAILILKIPQLGTEDVATVLEWVFYILLPNFAFGSSLQDFFINYESKRACTKDDIPWETFCVFIKEMNLTNGCCKDACGPMCISWEENIFSFSSPGIGRACLFLGMHGFLFLAMIFLKEAGLVKRFWQHLVEGASAAEGHDNEAMLESDHQQALIDDEDVAIERGRIQNTPLTTLAESDSLILAEIKKYYGKFLAVDRLSVGIPQGECFGLLGVNGAGKTTTFKMMTGDESLSAGDALLDGYSVKRDIKEVQQRLGYCPQFDALIEQMTVRETLRMYARLRGVAEVAIPDVIDKMIDGLLLKEHADKQAGDLSGGNKRKLSTAIALVGDPPIIFLDEPTTGMDPVARRLLWDTLTTVRASGRTLVLTSHSMEECEALCTRLAIMVNGQFKCLGSTQHLKTKFGEGYTLIAKVRGSKENEIDTRTDALKNFIARNFPHHTLKDQHRGLVHYQIFGADLTWSRLFGTMERAKGDYCIEDYSVSQTTLEQVFLNFARNQLPPFISNIGCKVKCQACCSFFCGCCCKNGGD